MRGVTLAEISESTKISKRWLQALEDEEFGLLPGGVFNRGFVRAYAHFLGLNEEQAVEDYLAASNEQAPLEDKFPLEIHEKPDKPALNPKRSALPVILAALALILLIGGWTFWVKHKSQESAGGKPNPNPSNVSGVSSESPGAPASVPTARADGGKSQAASEHVSDSGQPEQNNAQNGTRELRINARQPSNDAGQELGGSFSVMIKAKEDTWISIVADGKTLWEGTLSPNDERSVTADKELILKTGNAAGIEVSYNGKALGALGGDKQVRTLTFNTAGLQQ